jgi:hypothetical protein|tara:strand:- start:3341 stop:3571 length:231 start_codon:yes stop_codon:yes gene_type:complete
MKKKQALKNLSLIFVNFFIFSTLSAQLQVGDISPNFNAAACYNGGEEGFNSLYDAANGSVNGGEYKVVWINLFTSW